MKSLIPLTLAFAFTGAAHAATIITETFSMSTSVVIPDGDLSGLVQSITPATTIGTLDSITVSLNTSGGWNGDLYAYLWHDGKISVLLNRTGRTNVNDAGSATGGITVVLSDLAIADIHSAPGGYGSPIIGNFQPDGRNIHPDIALDTTPRTASLSVFAGGAAAGEWRLYIADIAKGDAATLQSWSISMTGEAIPEPGTSTLAVLASLLLLRRRR